MAENTVKVRRANVVLRVKQSEVDRYIDLGYKQIDDNGNVLREGVPSNLADLRMAYVEHKRKIAELEAEIEQLKADATPKKRVAKKSEE